MLQRLGKACSAGAPCAFGGWKGRTVRRIMSTTFVRAGETVSWQERARRRSTRQFSLTFPSRTLWRCVSAIAATAR